MDKIVDNEKLCTGCTACLQICIHGAISMKENNEGFLYPEIDENKCTDCGACKKICPVNKAIEEKVSENSIKSVNNIKAYACYSQNDDLRLKSSSGGLFSLLANQILKDNGAVFGAEYDENFNVRHNYVENLDKLDTLRRSKYVQSSIGLTYKKAGEFLKEGRKVLFCGTPCQIAGLKAFLGKEYPQLLTCDLACSGTPSPLIWKMYVKYMKEKYNSNITEISFRNKAAGWSNYNMEIAFNNGSLYRHKAKTETFFIGFGKNVFNRSSCFHCKFRIQNTKADITLADFWGIDKLGDQSFVDDKGVSLAIPNTKAGLNMLMALKDDMCIKERLPEEAINGNPRLVSSCAEPKSRIEFFNDLNSGFTFDKLRRKYMDNSSIKYRIKCLIKLVLNENIRGKIRGIIGK